MFKTIAVDSTKGSLGSKLISLLASLALVFSMCAIAPMSALAEDEPPIPAGEVNVDYGFEATQTVFEDVVVGTQLNLSDYMVNKSELTSHFDYVLTEGTGLCNVNRHSGVFTANAAGKAIVKVFLSSGEPQGGTAGWDGPCWIDEGSVELFITMTDSGQVYGFQGGDVQIKIVDPEVLAFEGDMTAGYTNGLGGIPLSDDGYYYFTIEMNSGFKDYNTPFLFAERNAGNIVAKNSLGAEVAVLDSQNTSAVNIAKTDHANKTIVVRVADYVLNGGGELVFLKDFRANNEDNVLGTTVSFSFSKKG